MTRHLVALTAALILPLALRGETPAPLLKVGFAERDITPEIGMEAPGGYGKSYHRTLHDPCKVRAVVFDDGKARVALVGLDALAVPRHVVLAARKGIEEKCGIPPTAVLLNASHSHSSGPLYGVIPGEYDHASPLVRTLAYEKSTTEDPKFSRRCTEQIIAAVCQADASRQEARCGVGTGIEEKAAFNRRFFMKNGLTWTHPGKHNPEVLKPAGPIDPQVGVIGAWSKDGKLLGCVVNYACHATTNPGGISANWIYYLEQVIRGLMGKDVVVVFLQGACGDVTQVDNLSPHANPAPEDWARLVGGRVGAEAVKVLLSMPQGSLAPVAADATVLKFQRRVPSPERVQRCLEMVKDDPKKVGAAEWTFAKEIVLLDALLQKQPTAEAEVQAIQVGPAVFVSNPAELFVQLGLGLKAKSPFPYTFPTELSNGCVGYVPTEEALGERGGGYETRLTSYSNLEPKAGPRMIAAGLELVAKLKPGKAPEPARAPVGTPWSYGNVAPELR